MRRRIAIANPGLARSILRLLASARVRRRLCLLSLDKDDPLKLPAFAPNPGSDVRTLEASTRSYAKELKDAADVDGRKRLEAERDELSDRLLLADTIPKAEAEVARLKALKLVAACLPDTTTNLITKLGNDIADTVITAKIRDQFQSEIVSLAANKVRVEAGGLRIGLLDHCRHVHGVEGGFGGDDFGVEVGRLQRRGIARLGCQQRLARGALLGQEVLAQLLAATPLALGAHLLEIASTVSFAALTASADVSGKTPRASRCVAAGVEHGLLAGLRHGGDSLGGEFLGELCRGGTLGAPERQAREHREDEPAGKRARRLAVVPGHRPEDGKPRLQEVEGDAGECIGPAVSVARPSRPPERARQLHRRAGARRCAEAWLTLPRRGA